MHIRKGRAGARPSWLRAGQRSVDVSRDVVTITRRLGHASPTVTLAVYAHLFRMDDSKAADAINTALASLGAS
jgi:integrase